MWGFSLSLVDLSGVYPVSCCMIAAVGSCIPDLDLKKWMAILCISNQKMLKFNKILILSSLAKLEENIKAFTELKDELTRIWSLSLFVYQGKIKWKSKLVFHFQMVDGHLHCGSIMDKIVTESVPTLKSTNVCGCANWNWNLILENKVGEMYKCSLYGMITAQNKSALTSLWAQFIL